MIPFLLHRRAPFLELLDEFFFPPDGARPFEQYEPLSSSPGIPIQSVGLKLSSEERFLFFLSLSYSCARSAFLIWATNVTFPISGS